MQIERTPARWVAGMGSIVSLFGLMLGVDALQTVPPGNIAAHWPLDSATTTTADVSGNSNTATLVNSPTSTAALFGNGLQFASASSRSLTVANSASLDLGTGSFTVGAWVKPTGTAVQRIMNKWNGTVGFHFDINAGAGGANVAGNIRLRVKDNAAHDHDYFAAGAIGTGSWKHIAGTYDRTAKQARLYVNGVQVGATRDITNLTGALTNTTALEIGALTAAGFINGILDEPILYARALTLAEIKTLAGVPQNLAATTTLIDRVTLTWAAVSGAASYNVLRSATTGGPYTLLTTVAAPATSYTDITALSPGPYFYVLQAVFTGAGGFTSTNSNQAQGNSLPPQVTALPNTGLQTNENGVYTSFTLRFNQPAPAGGSLVVVSSSDTAEGAVSTTFPGATPTATGFQVLVAAGTSPTFTVIVTGTDDSFADGARPYAVSVTASGFTGLAIPDVQCTNNDNDTPGVTINRTSGLVTTESGGQDTFAVTLNTQPYGPITMSLSSTLPAEGTVSATVITFTTANWNIAQPVTVTGVDDAALDFTVPYTVMTGALATTNANDTAAYNGLNPPDVQVSNLDDETIPPLEEVWGGGGGSGGGGCGLLGLEAVLALLLVRRRRRA